MESNKIIRIVFLCVLMGFLLLPALLFNFSGTEAAGEKRLLAPPPHLLSGTALNPAFFSEAEAYISDRFGLRSPLRLLHSTLDAGILHSCFSDRMVLIGKEGWLFYIDVRGGDDDNLKNFLKEDILTEQQLARGVELLQNRREWCRAHGMEFLVLICPNKHNVYGEFYPLAQPEGITRGEQFAAVLSAAGIPFVFPLEEIRARKESYGVPLYFKTDTHWNGLGAMIMAEYARPLLCGLFPDADFPAPRYTHTFSQMNGHGDLVSLLGLPAYGDDWAVSVQRVPESVPSGSNTAEDGGNALPRALLFGDSFSEALEPFLAPYFASVDYRFSRITEDAKADILQVQPDIVIWEWVERKTADIIKDVQPDF